MKSELDKEQKFFECVQAFVQENVRDAGSLTRIERLAGGQSNPTFKLVGEGRSWVLRQKPVGALLSGAHALEREYRVLSALSQTPVPAAKPLLYCDDETILGSEFYIMEFLEGRVLEDPALPTFPTRERTAIYRSMCEALSNIHRVDLKSAGLTDYGRHENYFERQVRLWTRQYRAAETQTISEMDDVIEWMSLNCVPDDGQACLVHGDYRLDNLMLGRFEPSVVAVLDWELSTIGHPMADLAYQCAQWRLPNTEAGKGLQGIDRASLGIPTEQEYVQMYCRLSGIEEINNWNFYLAFSFFRLASITQGIMKRAIDGIASSKLAFEVGAFTPMLALNAKEIAFGDSRLNPL